MAEVMAQDGTWTFDGELVRIVPGGGKKSHKLRQTLGELTVPVGAIAGVAIEPDGNSGRLRLRLRDGADPFLHVASGKLKDDADPYRLEIDKRGLGVAEYLVDEIRNALIIDQIAPGPCSEFMMSGPTVPLAATAGDGTVSFDGHTIRIEWTGWAEDVKKSSGPQQFALTDVSGVEWMPIVGWTNGFLRFRVTGASALAPTHDPYCITWGWQVLGGTTSLLAAAVVARLPHPGAGATPKELGPASGTSQTSGDDHDVVLRRLRELSDLYNAGMLTDDEFTAAKTALLGRL